MKKINIAIDGPAGSGKGTLAREIARRLDYLYIDSGVMYRLLTYLIIKNNISLDDEERINDLLINEFDYDIKEEKVYYNDEDVTFLIRSKEVNEIVSNVAGKSYVRRFFVDLLKVLASEKGVVMDGRDITSVVLDDAELKIYLDARFDVRAKRRYDDAIKRNKDIKFEEVEDILRNRDYKDIVVNKALVKGDDCVLIDTSDMSKEETIDKVLDLVRRRISDD